LNILESQDLNTIIDHEIKECAIYSLNLLNELIKEGKDIKISNDEILELKRKEYIVII